MAKKTRKIDPQGSGPAADWATEPQGKVCKAAEADFKVSNGILLEELANANSKRGEARIKKVVHEGGFSRFRRAAETPFNLIFEAKL